MAEEEARDHEDDIDYKAAAFNAINENERLRSELRKTQVTIDLEDLLRRLISFVEEHYIFCIVMTYVVVNLCTLAMDRRRHES